MLCVGCRWISHRLASHLARQNKTPEELEEERKTKERVEKEHWCVVHMQHQQLGGSPGRGSVCGCGHGV